MAVRVRQAVVQSYTTVHQAVRANDVASVVGMARKTPGLVNRPEPTTGTPC